jgi:hypothetical protein
MPYPCSCRPGPLLLLRDEGVDGGEDDELGDRVAGIVGGHLEGREGERKGRGKCGFLLRRRGEGDEGWKVGAGFLKCRLCVARDETDVQTRQRKFDFVSLSAEEVGRRKRERERRDALSRCAVLSIPTTSLRPVLSSGEELKQEEKAERKASLRSRNEVVAISLSVEAGRKQAFPFALRSLLKQSKQKPAVESQLCPSFAVGGEGEQTDPTLARVKEARNGSPAVLKCSRCWLQG